jgi:hypothetical protein
LQAVSPPVRYQPPVVVASMQPLQRFVTGAASGTRTSVEQVSPGCALTFGWISNLMF